MKKTNLKGKAMLVFNEMLLTNGNETQAYQNVFNCKYETANKNARAFMVKYGIREEYEKQIQHLKEKVLKVAEVTLEEVIRNARFVIDECKKNPDKIDKINLLRANEQLGKISGAFKETEKKDNELSEENKKILEDFVANAKRQQDEQRKKIIDAESEVIE